MRACKCCGKCCESFYIDGKKKDWKPGIVVGGLLNKKGVGLDDEEVKLMRKIFRRSAKKDALGHYRFTCLWYREVLKVCRHHNKKPSICRSFLCNEVKTNG